MTDEAALHCLVVYFLTSLLVIVVQTARGKPSDTAFTQAAIWPLIPIFFSFIFAERLGKWLRNSL